VTLPTVYDTTGDGSAIPDSAPVAVMGYVDGEFRSFAPLVARFPKAIHLPITVTGLPGVRIIDVEALDVSVPGAVADAAREVSSGRRPTLYGSQSTWDALDPALASIGLARMDQVDGILADPGTVAALTWGFVAKQFAWPGLGLPESAGYDLSVADPVWLGIAPSPAPPTPPPPIGATLGNPDYQLSPVSKLPVVAARTPDDSLWLWWENPDATWSGPLGVGAPGSTTSDPVMKFSDSGLISIVALGPAGLPYYYWQAAGGTFHGPLAV
jgi:hypothetical protein